MPRFEFFTYVSPRRGEPADKDVPAVIYAGSRAEACTRVLKIDRIPVQLRVKAALSVKLAKA